MKQRLAASLLIFEAYLWISYSRLQKQELELFLLMNIN